MKKARLIYQSAEQLKEQAITKASKLEASNMRKVANVLDDKL